MLNLGEAIQQFFCQFKYVSMKKIVVAFDNMHYSEGTMQFILRLHQQEPVSVTGVFLPQLEYSALWSAEAGAYSGAKFVALTEEAQADTIHETISKFEACCRQNNIQYHVQKDFFDFTLKGLQQETRFADLLVIGNEAFYGVRNSNYINDFLHDILHRSECPLLLIPEQTSFPNNNIIAYDGSEAAAFAIKQFAYLFPELCTLKTVVVYLNGDQETMLPQEKKLKDLMSRHYTNYQLLSLHLDARRTLTTWLSEQQGSLLISGAFGRSFTSQLFRRSFMYDVITENKIPVFIAHK